MDTTISFTLTPTDLEDWLRHSAKAIATLPLDSRGMKQKRNQRRSFLVWVVVLSLAVILFTVLHNNSTPPTTPRVTPPPSSEQSSILPTLLPYLIIFAIIFIFIRFRMRKGAIAKKAWDDNPDFQQPQTIHITSENLTITTPTSETCLAWTHFLHFYETPSLFLLYNTSRAAHLLPKRAFPAPASIDTFRQLCQERILKVPSAFPVQTTAPNP